MSDLVLYEIDGPVGTITLNRPEARNALTFEMYDRVAEICAAPSADGGVKALIVTGAGQKAFAAGTDISLFKDFKEPKDALAYEERIEKALTAIETSPVPTIAAISGACTGGGAALGNCLSMANYARLVAMIGAGRVLDMVVTARLTDAVTAKAIGLVSEVVPDHAAVMARAKELAATIAGHAPITIQTTKEALRRLRQGRRDDEDLIVRAYMSEDFREGQVAFLGKRRPEWKGR